MAATTIIKLTTIVSLLLPLLLAINSQMSFSQDIEDDEEYVLDVPMMSMRPGSRFLASVLKKGARCTAIPVQYNICNGVKANNGTSLLNCCKKHCRNILGDRNNCRQCGHKCKFNERCCHGTCTNIISNVDNCGKCDRKCKPGVRCEYKICGYN